jgi:hypothetical protein
MERKFKITKVTVHAFSTGFSIKDLDHKNKENSMSPEAFFHHIGGLAGRSLDKIEGLEFSIKIKGRAYTRKNDPLNMCGKRIGG